MTDHLNQLKEHIGLWRSANISDYWVHIGYIGSELNRFGDHSLTYVDGSLWHLWDGRWREIVPGSDFWLFSVPGAFAWARDMITKVMPSEGIAEDALTLRFDAHYGYVSLLRIAVGQRASANFTFEVKGFGAGPHPEFKNK